FFAFQGRSLHGEEPKYLTITLDESSRKLYGLERVNFSKPVYVVEGPIDSLFLSNALATAGGDLISELEGFEKENFIVVYDCEPRNKHTVKKIRKAIKNDFKVVIWPSDFNFKDINDAVLGGLTQAEICTIIENRTFSENEALLELEE